MMTATELLDLTFAALADPTRRAILARLADGEATVTELAAPFAMSQPAVSKHLKVLERAGLISRGRDAQRRPCRLEAHRLKTAVDWLEDYRHYWEESYGRLDALLEHVQAGRPGGTPDGAPGGAADGSPGGPVAGPEGAPGPRTPGGASSTR
jgi:DNA-binding transcriptional ArsR family regulator